MKKQRIGMLWVLALAVICAAVMILLPAAAEVAEKTETVSARDSVDVTIGNYKYRISLGKAKLIAYTGREVNITIPSSVEYDGVINEVNAIGSYVFSKNEQLESVVIPNSISTMETSVFSNCINLKSVTFQGDIPYCSAAFYNTGSHSGGYTVTFESGVTKIPNKLFYTEGSKPNEKYAFVKKVIMADTVQEIGSQAFERCYDLNEIIWSSNLLTIGSSAFAYDTGLTELILPGQTKFIDQYAFDYCESLKTVVLPASLKTMRSSAFRNCIALTSLTVNGDIPTYSESFYNTGSLSGGYTVTFGEGVTRIPDSFFKTEVAQTTEKYAYVTKVIFPDSLTEIGKLAFMRCYSLSEIVWGSGLKTIGIEAFDYDSALTEIRLPGQVKEIGNYAFRGCAGIKTILLPGSLNKLGTQVFENCVNLQSVTINGDIASSSSGNYFKNTGSASGGYTVTFGEGVTTVPYALFYYNTSPEKENYAYVTKVTLPDSVKTISKYAFECCYSLSEISLGLGLELVDENAFLKCDALATVRYAGKPSQWELVVIKKGNDALLNAEILFGDSDPVEPTSIKLNKKKASMVIGKKLTLKATVKPANAETTLTWSSSDEKVATVSQKGVVKAVGKGKATITVETANGLKATCAITVKAPKPTSVSLDRTGTVTMKVGKKLKLKATLKPKYAETTLTWESSNEDVAFVSSKGVVIAMKKGTATITVTTANGKTAKVKIKVK